MKFWLNFLLFTVLEISEGRRITAKDPVEIVIRINNGQVAGRKNKTLELEKRYYSFRGIPYAEPPIGNLRFQPPVLKRNWSYILDAFDDAPSCLQSAKPTVGDEDCLYLNVYTPNYPSEKDCLSPVMVWIYGGGFQAGVSNYNEYGPDYLLDQDVIIVSINYRLGIFGFLSTGDMEAPGNNGLKDQVFALKWVQDNIKYFGGDPKQVTLFGQSAGSASVAYQMQSKLSRGLFQRTILESGTSLCLWAYSRHNKDIAFTVGRDLKIFTENSRVLVDSLKRINATQLQEAATAAVTFKYLTISAREGFLFSPVLEPEHKGAFQTEKSHLLLSRGDYAQVPSIVGFNSLEGTFPIIDLVRLILSKWDFNPGTIVPIDMNIKDGNILTQVGRQIKQHYFGVLPVAFSNLNIMIFMGDDQFVRPIREFVRLTSQRAPVYYYKFSYEGNLWGFYNRSQSGVTHSEELGYLWRSKHQANHQDEVIRRRMVKMWTNFAKEGNPTPKMDSTFNNLIWPVARSSNKTDLHYLEINNELEIKVNPDDKNIKFWDSLFKKYARPPYDTY